MTVSKEAKKTSSPKTEVSTFTEEEILAMDEELEEEILPMDRKLAADVIIHRNILWSMGGGIIPFPMVDIVAISAIQLKMLAQLSSLYGVSFSENTGKSLIAALANGCGAQFFGVMGMSFVKSIPVVGSVIGGITVPILAGAGTYATGKVFVKHFESGGTLLDFKVENFKKYYQEKQKTGKRVAKKIHEDKMQPQSQ